MPAASNPARRIDTSGEGRSDICSHGCSHRTRSSSPADMAIIDLPDSFISLVP
jgi:hypothetical protein